MITRPAFARSVTGGYQRTPRGRQPLAGLAAMGRHGDTELAHVNPQEAALLEARGGSGTINPSTGLREYYNPGDSFSGSGGTGDSGHASYGGQGYEAQYANDGTSGNLFADAAAFQAALAAHQNAQAFGGPGAPAYGVGGAMAYGGSGFRPENNPELGPQAQAPRAFIEAAQPTFADKAKAFALGTAMPFGIDVQAKPDYLTGQPKGVVSFAPLQGLANMGPFGPLGDAMAPDWGSVEVAEFGMRGTPSSRDRDTIANDDDKAGGDPMQARIDALMRSILQAPESDTRAAEPARPAQKFTPYEGDPYKYGTPSGPPSHAFFTAS